MKIGISPFWSVFINLTLCILPVANRAEALKFHLPAKNSVILFLD